MNCRFESAEPITILEDTRQQTGKHDNIHRWCAANGVRLVRTKLLCGDYTLPTDQRVCVDTKFGLAEIYSDLIGKDHDRFVRELEQAKSCGIRLVILIEERGINCIEDVQNWINPRLAKWQMTPKQLRKKNSPVSSAQLMKIMQTVSERHGCEFQFCAKSQTGRKIYEILTGAGGEENDC